MGCHVHPAKDPKKRPLRIVRQDFGDTMEGDVAIGVSVAGASGTVRLQEDNGADGELAEEVTAQHVSVKATLPAEETVSAGGGCNDDVVWLYSKGSRLRGLVVEQPGPCR